MTIRDAADQLPAGLFPPLPVCWALLDDLETEDALDELQDWVDWAVDRYRLDRRTVPPCWDQHGALVEELSALRTAWVAAYALTARPDAALDWHLAFALARERLSGWSARTGCRPGEHRAD
jgi:hypothetical protein